MRVILTRDSVCAGDDINAPHSKKLFFFWPPTIEALIRKIQDSNYLAQISGGKATWIAKIDGTSVAVVAQEWSAPKYFISSKQKIRRLRDCQSVELFFEYLAQADPEEAFKQRSKSVGSPIP